MKTTKRLLCALLAVLMLSSLSLAAFAEESSGPFSYYAALGDSIPWHVEKDQAETVNALGFRDNTYPAYLLEHYAIPNGFYGTRCGWRATEALIALVPDYYGDDYSENFLPGWGGMNVDQIKALSPAYREAIFKADLITLNFGSNELLGTKTYIGQKTLLAHTAGTPLEQAAYDILEKAKQCENMWDGLEMIINFMQERLDDVAYGVDFVTDLTEAMADFPLIWDTLISEIRKLNPTALIVAVNVYNPKGFNNIEGIVSQPLIDGINLHMKSTALIDSNYIFVETGLPDMTGSRDGSHLGNAGHREVADKIIAKIDDYLPCQHKNCERVRAREATKLTFGYTGDLFCYDCGRIIEYGEKVTYCGKSFDTVIGILDKLIDKDAIKLNNSIIKNIIAKSIDAIMYPARLIAMK